MNTAITDELWQARDGETFAYHSARIKDGMTRLELDRAALMEALGECLRSMESDPKCTYWLAKSNAQTALAAARANFPTP